MASRYQNRKRKLELDEVTREPKETQVFRRLLPYIRPHLGGLGLVALLLVYSVGVALYAPRLLGRIVEQALIPHDRALLLQLCGIFVTIELGWMVAKILESYFLQKIGQQVMQSVRMDLFGRMVRMPVPFYDRNPTGKLVTRITNDTANLLEIFGSGFVTLFSDILVVLGVLGAMLALDWKLGLITLTVFPFMAYAMDYFSKRLRGADREARWSLSSLNAFFAERVSGMPIVQLMRMEEHERKRFDKLSLDYFTKQMGSVNVFAFFHPTITILTASSIALVLYFGGSFVAEGAIGIGVFVSFLAYVQVLFQPVRGLTEKYNIYQNAMASAEQIFSLLSLDEEAGLRAARAQSSAPSSEASKSPEGEASKPWQVPGGDAGAAVRERLRGDISFENVSFSYAAGAPSSAARRGGAVERSEQASASPRRGSKRPQVPGGDDAAAGGGEPQKWALKGANFHVRANEKIAVVGHTGAGKSTLLALLFRFYDPQRGRILVDGREIEKYPKQFLRRRFGFVQQDVFIFAGTVRENLVLLGEGVTEARMLEACRATGMDRIVAKLSQGYATRLDERGSNLSLGERQVLAITRVLLQEPDVLILDEATSHVDTESEKILQRAMEEVTKNRTSIIIAHRLSTIRDADRILVFEKGEIIESGPHAELIAKQGVYYIFTASQSLSQ